MKNKFWQSSMGPLVLAACALMGNASSRAAETAPRRPHAKEWSLTDPVPEPAVRSARLLRERMLADRHRPGYHFCLTRTSGSPATQWAFWHNGRYHLMYLYNRSGSGFCWGHVSSKDLVHWRHHPTPSGPVKATRVASVAARWFDTDGTAYLSYWMLWGAKGIGLAAAAAELRPRTKLDANPVSAPPNGELPKPRLRRQELPLRLGDPRTSGRKTAATTCSPATSGVEQDRPGPNAPLDQQGDRLYLFLSDDLKTWKYLHVFYQRKAQWTDRSEDNMCPSFLPLPSSPEGGLPAASTSCCSSATTRAAQYYVGDYREDRFFPDNHGRMTWVDNTYFAPEA